MDDITGDIMDIIGDDLADDISDDAEDAEDAVAVAETSYPPREEKRKRDRITTRALRRILVMAVDLLTPSSTVNMDRQISPLAGKQLGQEIKEIAQATSRELLRPMNGIDYHHHRPGPYQSTEDIIEAVYNLHTKPDANDVITFIIRTNIETLQHVEGLLEEYYEGLEKRSTELDAMDTEYDGIHDKEYIRKEVAVLDECFDEHERWTEIIDLELEMSNVALERMGIARAVIELGEKEAAGAITADERFYLEEPKFLAFRNQRMVLMRLVRLVNEKTGDAEFLTRHRNELWDVVGRQVG